MNNEPTKHVPVMSHRQLAAIVGALMLHGSVPLLHGGGSDNTTEQAIVRIGDELEKIRSEFVAANLDQSKMMATAMQELADHSRRLENLETSKQRR